MADAVAALRRLIIGYRLSQALHVAAGLGIADLLAAGPRDAGDLAAATGTRPDALRRVLRLLAIEGVLAVEGGRFRLTALGEPLRSDAPRSLRRRAINDGAPENWRAWGELLHSVRTGEAAFERAHGAPLFDHLARHPDAAATFDRLMAEQTDGWAGAVIAAYDLSRCRTLVDVGGGRGALLAAALQANPGLRGILLDLPHVVPAARAALERAGVAARCEVVGGDFRAAVPEGGDVYLLKQVLHDWSDDQAQAILACCRRAVPPEGRLLIVEVLLGSANAGSYGHYLDLHMLVLAAGRDRDLDGYRALLEATGFRLVRALPTSCELSIIEAAPAALRSGAGPP